MKTLHEFISQILVKETGMISESLPTDHTTAFKYPPPFLTMKRKAVRAFPDGQHVAVYYIAQLDKFISIPFGTNTKKDSFDIPALGEEVLDEASYRESDATHPYSVVDRHTKQVVSKHKTRVGASRIVDKRDNEYGAYRYHVHNTEMHGPYKPVNELSQDTLHTYKDAAIKSAQDNFGDSKHNNGVFAKRVKGIVVATHKIKEESLDEATKPKKKAKIKVKPYDFFKHLKDIAKGGEDKNKPLRFSSGERHKMQPEMAQLLLHAHGKLNPMNQAKAHKAMRTNKKLFNRFHDYALGVATVTK